MAGSRQQAVWGSRGRQGWGSRGWPLPLGRQRAGGTEARGGEAETLQAPPPPRGRGAFTVGATQQEWPRKAPTRGGGG